MLKIFALFHKKRESDGVVTNEFLATITVSNFADILEGINKAKSSLEGARGYYWITHQIIIVR